MKIESKLVHISENKAVVQVSGWVNDTNVGSALAEASTVEDAEDRAISRLNQRVNIKDTNISINLNNEAKLSPKKKNEFLKSEKLSSNTEDKEPTDWSNELTAIDSEIKRLNWTRDDETNFLRKNLGFNNRTKITKYNELINYLDKLRKIDINNSYKSNTTKFNDMIKESDILLRKLSWDNKQGREYLKKEFNVLTRKELDETQLISFVEQLKSILNQSI